MSERIVSPEEAREWSGPGWRAPLQAEFSEQLCHTVATEPDRIADAERRGAVKALREAADNWEATGGADLTARYLRNRARQIRDGRAAL
jgi:hypothetical protein